MKNKIPEKRTELVKGPSRLWGGVFTYFGYISELHNSSFKIINDRALFVEVNFEKYYIHDMNENIIECVKCKDRTTLLNPCNNCGQQDKFYWTEINVFQEDKAHLTCANCHRTHQQNRWICKKCSCDNTIGNTLFHQEEIEGPIKEGCFIATVCYENYSSKEVLVFRKFRDEKLLKTKYGRLFIHFYYVVAPYFSNVIAKSNILKIIIRKCFLEPIANYLQMKNSINYK